jgi:hypothetical protein
MAHVVRLSLAVVVGVVVAGCGLLLTDVRVPRAYRSATPGDVKATPGDLTASGEACYQSVLYLVAWGDASYAAATRRALGSAEDATLYDVKADVKATSVLFGLYSRVCTVVTGRIGRP